MKRPLLVLATVLFAGATWASGDLVRSADQITPTEGRLLVHQDAAHRVKTVRVRIPPNTDLAPHGSASGYFIATVLSGTLQLGIGPAFDADKLRSLAPGSVFSHSAQEKHYARTGAQAVVLQVTTVGAEAGTHKH